MRTCSILLLFLLNIISVATVQAQSPFDKPLSLGPDLEKNQIFHSNPSAIHSRIEQMIQESGYPLEHYVTQYFKPAESDLLDGTKPMRLVVYGMRCYTLKPKADLSQLAFGPTRDFGKPFRLSKEGKRILMGVNQFFGGSDHEFGVVKGGEFITARTATQLEKYLGDKTRLWDNLNPRLRRLFHQSGSVFYAAADGASFIFPDLGLDFSPVNKSQEAQKILKDLEEIVATADRAGLGVKYDKSCLGLEGVVKLKQVAATERVFNLDVLDAPGFEHTIGLPADDLLVAASFQAEAFKSEEFVALLPMLDFGDFRFANSNAELAYGVLLNSWFQMRGGRAALYSDHRNQFGVVSIVDPKNPESFIESFKKTVKIIETPAEVPQAELDAELANLVSQLGSRKFSERNGAYQKLILAGEKALPILQQTLDGDVKPEVKRLASRAIKHISAIGKKRKGINTQSLESTDYWLNLKPAFSLQENVKYGDEEVTLIQVHPDPEVDAERWAKTNAQLTRLFGANWNRIPVLRVGDRYVMMFGSNKLLFQKAVSNLKEKMDPISARAKGQNERAVAGQFRIYFNTPMIYNHAPKSWFWGYRPRESITDSDGLTLFNFRFAKDFWEFAMYFPREELETFAKLNW